MRYLVLLYQDESTLLTPADGAEWEAEMAGYLAFNELAGPTIIDGDPLVPFGTRTIRHDGGQVRTTDGPFAETTEVLGGYYILDVPSLDDAIELVRHIPATAKGGAELRPVAELMEIGPQPAPEGTARWMVTIHGTETEAETPGTDAWEAGYSEHARFGEKAGEAVLGGAALHPTTTASTVRVRDGELLVTDGPYAEAVEVVGGYYLLRATPEGVLDLAADVPVPDGGGGAVEVRQIMEIG
jgi:hypothetical protein